MIHILAVDDEQEILDLFVDVCQDDQNVTLTTCISALDAISELSQNSYDVVISDLNMPVISGKQLIGYIDSNIGTRNTIVFLYSSDVSVEKFTSLSPNVKGTFNKSLNPIALMDKVKKEQQKYARKTYSESLTNILRKASIETIKQIMEAEPTCNAPFLKKTSHTFGELSAMIPIFGLQVYGSVAVSMEKGNVNHAISKFSDETSETIKESMMLDFIIDITNSLGGNIKRSLKRKNIDINIGIPTGKKGLRLYFPHLVSGPVLCLPITFDGDMCFTEFCFGGLQSDAKPLKIFD